jgi:exodeoxyribonuclease VIII
VGSGTGEEMNGKFVDGMPNGEYHSLDGISKSGLDKIARSPAHYRLGLRKPATQNMHIGTAIHTAILEPDRFDFEYVVIDGDRRGKEYKEAVKSVGAELVILKKDHKKVLSMRESCHDNFEAMQILTKPGKAELSAICTDPETGVQIRARFDWLTDCGISLDVKKTQDIRKDKFSKSVFDYRYHVQDAMYSFVYQQVTGQPIQAFKFLAVEEEAPNSSKVYELGSLEKEMGAYYFRRDLRVYAECVNSGKWPHPECGDGVIELSNWAVAQYENDLEVII